MRFPTFQNEVEHLNQGYDLVAGCDEVGRGPLAGPVVAVACLLDPNSISKNKNGESWHSRVRDSKTINEREREKLVGLILEHTLAYGVGEVWQDEIDKFNIHNASLLAMRKATENMLSKVDSKNKKIILFVDGSFKIPELNIEQKSMVKGDSLVLSISAASIIAKVHRDNIMKKLGNDFPNYGFGKHKGYGTREHKDAIKKFGVTRHHRRTFLKNFM